MKIAARRIDAKRPARFAKLFPRREPERMAQQIANRTGARWNAGVSLRIEELIVRRSERLIDRTSRTRRGKQHDFGCARKTPERMRLRRPVEIPERSRELMEMVLRAVVVPKDGATGRHSPRPSGDRSPESPG